MSYFKRDKDGNAIWRSNGDGTARLVYGPEGLRHQRLRIKAGIPLCLPPIEQRVLIDIIKAKDPDGWDEWYHHYCDSDHFLEDLRRLARYMGIKHWMLK